MKKLLLLIVLFNIFFVNNINSQLRFAKKTSINENFLLNPANVSAPIVLTRVPSEFLTVGSRSRVGLNWTRLKSNAICEVRLSRKPGTGDAKNAVTDYPIVLKETGQSQISFSASGNKLSAGLYYCIVHKIKTNQNEPDTVSAEFNIVVEHKNPPPLDKPTNGISVNQQDKVTFEWGYSIDTTATPDYRAPYYHILISDKPFEIQGDIVKGANIVWQTIVPINPNATSVSIGYGDPDPSGSFDNSKTPPLIPGTYNWVVLNNYGNNPALTSEVSPQPSAFIIKNTSNLLPPVLTGPTASTISTKDITFVWQKVENAYNYKFLLFEEKEEDGSLASGLIFEATTFSTSILVKASEFMVDARYYWKVIASNDKNQSVSSELKTFLYDADAGFLKVSTIEEVSRGSVGRVNLKIARQGGATIDLPFITDSGGEFSKQLGSGTYIITATKNGYNTGTGTAVVKNNDTTSVTVSMSISNTIFYGVVTDVLTSSVIIGAQVHFISDSTGHEFITTTDESGNYKRSLFGGKWHVFVRKSEYKTTSDTLISINAGETKLLNFKLQPSVATIDGYTTNRSKLPLQNISVTATDNKGNSISTTTDKNGYYKIKLSEGKWTLKSNSTGYLIIPQNYELDLKTGDTKQRSFTLIKSGIVQGNVKDQSLNQSIPLVKVVADSSGEIIAQTSTNELGYYQLSLKPLSQGSKYKLSFSISGYAPRDTSIAINEGETKIVDFKLVKYQSFLIGTVHDSISNAPLSSAEVKWEAISTLQNGFTNTNSVGKYSLSVQKDLALKVTAKILGYKSQTKTISGIKENSKDSLNFKLEAFLSTLVGAVKDNVTGKGLDKAEIKITSLKKNYTDFVFTNSNGEYTLPTNPDSLTIEFSKAGYKKSTSVINLSQGKSTYPDILLQRDFPTFSGTVTDEANKGVEGAQVKITKVSGSGIIDETTTLTNSEGKYSVQLPPEGVYNFDIRKERYIITKTPTDPNIKMTSSGRNDIHFKVKKTKVTSITINPDKSEAINTDTLSFSLSISDSSGIQIPISYENLKRKILSGVDSTEITIAGSLKSNRPVFVPNKDYIGRVILYVEDTQEKVSGKYLLPVTAIIKSSTQVTLKDETGMELDIKSGSVPLGEEKAIRFRVIDVPNAKKLTRSAQVVGNSYGISEKTPFEFVQGKVSLILPVPAIVKSAEITKLKANVWDSDKIVWNEVSGATLIEGNKKLKISSISRSGEYALLLPSEKLGIKNIKFLPNPFSPEVINRNPHPVKGGIVGEKGLSIQFDLSSTDMTKPFVTITIYNMAGEFVRTLVDDSPTEKGPVAISWDGLTGLTNDRKMSRNGRYVVIIRARDSTGEKKFIGTVVLIK